MAALKSFGGAWVLVKSGLLMELVQEAALREDHVSSAQA